jgi:hypothetical protein
VAKADFSFVKKTMGKPGALHKALGVPMGKTIPVSKLQSAAKGTGT